MKTSIVLGRVAKVAAIVFVTATITWQARTEHQSNGDQQHVIPQPWAKHRKAQVKGFTHVMPNRFALSKAYYGTENIILEAAELARLRANGKRSASEPKS